ncbi:23S rRNA (pseudouridine(1915)-N(3))-methyltransferase RlmH, partial [candidate division KSB1 bacterium]|nr:23S rRNA (pseudouridine(1915)-N(3))-methyltransferase RlmH [candidate division KSB1 bacterium]
MEQGGYHEAAPRQIRTAISAKSKMLKIKIISVGRIKQKGWQAAESEYSQRIMRYAKLEHVFVKDAFLESIRNAKKVMALEADSILRKIKKNEFTVSLYRQGEQMSSREFAWFLSFNTLHGVSNIT